MTRFARCLAVFMTLTVAVASAATYNLQLFQPSTVAGKELKPGEYKLTVENDKAVIKKGKESVEATVKTESGSEKYRATTVRYTEQDGQMKIQEIRLGGTSTKLIFN